MKHQIRAYFEQLPSYRANPFALADEDLLLELGLVDSFGILELVDYLEDTFNIEVEPDDMLSEHFESIAAIERFLTAKQRQQSQVHP